MEYPAWCGPFGDTDEWVFDAHRESFEKGSLLSPLLGATPDYESAASQLSTDPGGIRSIDDPGLLLSPVLQPKKFAFNPAHVFSGSFSSPTPSHWSSSTITSSASSSASSPPCKSSLEPWPRAVLSPIKQTHSPQPSDADDAPSASSATGRSTAPLAPIFLKTKSGVAPGRSGPTKPPASKQKASTGKGVAKTPAATAAKKKRTPSSSSSKGKLSPDSSARLTRELKRRVNDFDDKLPGAEFLQEVADVVGCKLAQVNTCKRPLSIGARFQDHACCGQVASKYFNIRHRDNAPKAAASTPITTAARTPTSTSSTSITRVAAASSIKPAAARTPTMTLQSYTARSPPALRTRGARAPTTSSTSASASCTSVTPVPLVLSSQSPQPASVSSSVRSANTTRTQTHLAQHQQQQPLTTSATAMSVGMSSLAVLKLPAKRFPDSTPTPTAPQADKTADIIRQAVLDRITDFEGHLPKKELQKVARDLKGKGILVEPDRLVDKYYQLRYMLRREGKSSATPRVTSSQENSSSSDSGVQLKQKMTAAELKALALQTGVNSEDVAKVWQALTRKDAPKKPLISSQDGSDDSRMQE